MDYVGNSAPLARLSGSVEQKKNFKKTVVNDDKNTE